MWVTVSTVSWMTEAEVVSSALEANGIRTFLPDRGMVETQPLYANAIGGIRIQVDKADVPRAREILAEIETDMDEEEICCPECGCGSVELEKSSRRLSMLTILLLGFPLFRSRPKYRCRQCGHRWK